MKNPTVMFTAPRQVAIEDEPVPKPGSRQVLIETELTLVSTGTELTVLGRNSLSQEVRILQRRNRA
jgi:NADPH:quinone reductase-like Zn-dependent oxidoreductase